MRRFALAVVGLASCWAAFAWAAPAEAVTVNCGVRNVTYLFWPHGHQLIGRAHVPAYATPHMEIFKPVRRYASLGVLGFFDAVPRGRFAARCRTLGRSGYRASVRRRVVRTRATALHCSYPSAPKFKLDGYVKPNRRAVLRVLLGRSTVLLATVRRTGSVLYYDRRYCRTFTV